MKKWKYEVYCPNCERIRELKYPVPYNVSLCRECFESGTSLADKVKRYETIPEEEFEKLRR